MKLDKKAVTICVTRNRHENDTRTANRRTHSVTQNRDGLSVDPAPMNAYNFKRLLISFDLKTKKVEIVVLSDLKN